MEETYHASYLKANIKPSDTFAAFMVTDLNTSGYSKAELTDFQNEAMELYNQAKLRNDKVKIKQFDYILYSIAKNLERAKSGSPRARSRSPSPMRSPSPIASRRSGSPVIVRRRRSPSPIRRVRPRVALSPSPSPPPQRRRQEPSSGGTRKRKSRKHKHKSRKHKSKSRKYRK
jgi:hypothetical protein